MSNYQPAEGTVAARLIAALHEAGGTISHQAAAEQLGVPAKNIGPSLKAAVQAGLVHYTSDGRGTAAWHLPGTPAATDGAAPAPAPRKKTKRRQAAAPAPVDATEQAPVDGAAIAALWDDGDVVLAGIKINADAASVTLSDLQARRVHRFLERVYGPTA